MKYTDYSEVCFGVEGEKDEYGFANGHVNKTYGFFGTQELFSQEQKSNIYRAMRQQRLTGVELNPIQPLPTFLYGYSDMGDRGLAYHLAKDYSKWNDYAKKSEEIENIYCVTNEELIIHAPEVKDYFYKKAQQIVKRAGKNKEQIDIDALKQIKQILDDVNSIYKAIGFDNICNTLDAVYDKTNGITANKILNSIKDYNFNPNEEELSEEQAK